MQRYAFQPPLIQYASDRFFLPLKVYEVFNEAKDVFALKVVNLNDTKVKAELMAEIDFLKELQDSSKVINMIDYEIKEDVRGLPFLDHDVETGLKKIQISI